ncbi:Rrf2 family transcriptional regulator [Halorhodospira neutriphila]|uniref:Rrf2 family transcriptional regulator n=1 Tax=Halorhodospira neutriphila TaxID=168379 RepID=A0ABS1E936_9GAMM|nr:Rrf2 family transcriptional regulator [Halorhodospira neutriphila]MBK1727602.1 Rrf2 family transcriptional regulator [Halorhodospira neutriphila]
MTPSNQPQSVVQVTTRGRYAIGAVLHIALHDAVGPVPLAEISVCQNISTSYVDQIFAELRPAGVIEGIPGPGGGYRLARPAAQIRVAEILAAVEQGRAQKGYRSALEAAVWSRLMHDIEALMGRITIADLVERPGAQEWLARQYAAGGGPRRCEVCGVLFERGRAAAASATAPRD